MQRVGSLAAVFMTALVGVAFTIPQRVCYRIFQIL